MTDSVRSAFFHARGTNRRGFLGLLGASASAAMVSFLPIFGTVAAGENDSLHTLPLSRSLPQELAQARARGQPLLVMVSLDPCPWCELVRNNYLGPMLAREALPVVQMDMGSAVMTKTVDGEPIAHDFWIRESEVKLAPTVLFLGPDGREVADRLEGASPDFYSANLDRRLEQAREAIKP